MKNFANRKKYRGRARIFTPRIALRGEFFLLNVKIQQNAGKSEKKLPTPLTNRFFLAILKQG
ncbi:MAG: hypothetical protein FWG66_06160 [Spirochaetes bacterium]|nr:hypothetical protein [Spirochaetota bacterium]